MIFGPLKCSNRIYFKCRAFISKRICNRSKVSLRNFIIASNMCAASTIADFENIYCKFFPVKNSMTFKMS